MAFVSKLSNENKSHHILYHKRNIERSNIKDHSRILINLSPPEQLVTSPFGETINSAIFVSHKSPNSFDFLTMLSLHFE